MSVRGYAIDWYECCPYCGIGLTDHSLDDTDVEADTQRSKDHMVPQRVGGRTHGNLVWACLKCNRDKHHLTMLEWRVIRTMRGQGFLLAWDWDIPLTVWRWFRLMFALSVWRFV